MARMVFCSRLKKELPGLEAPPFPGPRGQKVYESVSKEAWEAWQAQQTILINEHQLDMRDKEARRYLNEQMDRYLNGEELEQAPGYVAPDSSDGGGPEQS